MVKLASVKRVTVVFRLERYSYFGFVTNYFSLVTFDKVEGTLKHMVLLRVILEERPILQLCTGHGLVLSKLVTSLFSHHAALILIADYIFFTACLQTSTTQRFVYVNDIITSHSTTTCSATTLQRRKQWGHITLSWFKKRICLMTSSRLLHPSGFDTCLKFMELILATVDLRSLYIADVINMNY